MDNLNRIISKFKNQHEQKTLRYLTSKFSSLPEEDIKDIVQDSYVVLCENLVKGKVNEPNYSYFLKICINLCLKKIKVRDGKVIVNIDDDKTFRDGSVSMSRVDEILQMGNESEEYTSELNELVHRTLDKMDKKCKEMLWNYYANDLSWATIATMFDLKNADTAKATASRCRKKFKEIFNKIKNEKSK